MNAPESPEGVRTSPVDIPGAKMAYDDESAIRRAHDELQQLNSGPFASLSIIGGHPIRVEIAPQSYKIDIAAITVKKPIIIYLNHSFLLACIDETFGCSQRLLHTIVQHEVGHFDDYFGRAHGDSYVTHSLNLQEYETSLTTITQHCDNMLARYASHIDVEQDSLRISGKNPLLQFYHSWLNSLDDTIVNNFSQRKGGAYTHQEFESLYAEGGGLFRENFPLNENAFEQFGHYLLTRTMCPSRSDYVDSDVSTVCNTASIQFGGSTKTLLELHKHFTQHREEWRAAKRYRYYILHYLPIFEQFLWDWLKDQTPESLQKKASEGGTFDTVNPQELLEALKPVLEEANKAAAREHGERKSENNRASQSPAKRVRESRSAAAQALAKQYDINPHAVNDFMRAHATVQHLVEPYATSLVNTVLWDSDEQISRTPVMREDAGTINMNVVLNQVSKILAGNTVHIQPLYQSTTLESIEQPYPVRLLIDLVLDNSGSTSSFIPHIQDSTVLTQLILKRAKEILNEDYGFDDVQLDLRITLFGNSARTILQPEGTDIDVMTAFEKITCDEGTTLQGAAALLEPPSNTNHLVILITDGYLSDPTEASASFKTHLPSSHTAVALLNTAQAIDISLDEFTLQERRALHNTDPKNRSDIDQVQRNLEKKIQEWNRMNAEALEHAPMEDWPNRTIVNNTQELAPLILLHTYQAIKHQKKHR